MRGEPDLRPLMAELCQRGKTVLLPIVAAREAPLIFRPWYPGCDMVRGLWNIPVPASGEPQAPDIVLAPVVGIDRDLYRLGNGGGYYDRTLAGLPARPFVIGAGFSFSRIPTIFPMGWDVPMDVGVSEKGVTP
ncbi:5-formyltetrahydrofolate cyclo-ligase [Roseibium sp. AS2]|uniref:5-formyltetrahydrofolate cyclo-ligase n=1 Tax=Roseibium sp. AS2 TaxID=3135781 RepID=UPI003174392C